MPNIINTLLHSQRRADAEAWAEGWLCLCSEDLREACCSATCSTVGCTTGVDSEVVTLEEEVSSEQALDHSHE